MAAMAAKPTVKQEYDGSMNPVLSFDSMASRPLEMRERRLSLADTSPCSSYSHKEVRPLILDFYSNYSSGSLGFYFMKIIILIAVIAAIAGIYKRRGWK
ncbi:hypothetical protein D5086_009540 [Populus alba]|uniref:Uncharacterized protein n=1 Tax=Populus alba TaxID=43335 RepID=A0ACC4CKY9_POPAL